ncbi:MAG: hypothetical protein EOM69_07440, partial [Clostridia bacterium]|nr:hypothetical protein [Clostridia bacterium]
EDDGYGWTYTGQWAAGHLSGPGTTDWTDGFTLSGEYKNDWLNGKGYESWYGVVQYEGDYKDSAYHGTGTYYNQHNEIVYAGAFADGLIQESVEDRAARVGAFKITSESSIAAGVRRIEAYVGKGILALVHEMDQALMSTAQSLKTTPADIGRKVLQTMGEMRELNRENETLRAKLSALRAIELLNFAKAAGTVNVLAVKVDETSADALRALSDSIRDRAPNMVCVLAMVTPEGKVQFAAACGKEAVKKGAHAGNLVRELAKMTGGGGGGRPDSAMAGGKEPEKVEAALEAVNNIVEGMLK